jgi:hypothetical protein
MRTALLALGMAAVGLLAAWALVNTRVELPPVGPGVEQICAETMQRTAADLSWVAPNLEERVHGREIKTVTLGNLIAPALSLASGISAEEPCPTSRTRT